jgi:hypothetical protein
MDFASLFTKAALALGGALDHLLLPGAIAGVLVVRAHEDGGAPIGEPDNDEGYFEDDDEDAEEDEEDDDEDPVRVD